MSSGQDMDSTAPGAHTGQQMLEIN